MEFNAQNMGGQPGWFRKNCRSNHYVCTEMFLGKYKTSPSPTAPDYSNGNGSSLIPEDMFRQNTSVCMYIYTYICMYIYIYAYQYLYIYIHVSTSVCFAYTLCMYIYILCNDIYICLSFNTLAYIYIYNYMITKNCAFHIHYTCCMYIVYYIC